METFITILALSLICLVITYLKTKQSIEQENKFNNVCTDSSNKNHTAQQEQSLSLLREKITDLNFYLIQLQNKNAVDGLELERKNKLLIEESQLKKETQELQSQIMAIAQAYMNELSLKNPDILLAYENYKTLVSNTDSSLEVMFYINNQSHKKQKTMTLMQDVQLENQKLKTNLYHQAQTISNLKNNNSSISRHKISMIKYWHSQGMPTGTWEH